MSTMRLSFALYAFYIASAVANFIEFPLRPLASERLSENATYGTEWQEGIVESSVLKLGTEDTLGAHDTFALFKRQVLTCPTGTYECTSTICCAFGDNCTGGHCCPGGKTICANRGCYNARTDVCCNDGTTCPRGYDCQPGVHCCPSGSTYCANNKCYSSELGQKCCSTGTVCPAGWDCVAGGGCCPSGQIRCGATKCYNPKIASCCSDGSGCVSGSQCVTGSAGVFCCPTGQIPCGTGRSCYDPKTEKCCGSSGYHCPKNYDCFENGRKCCKTGEKPCGSGACYNPTDAICCSSGLSVWGCVLGAKCCGFGNCCAGSDTCGSDGFCYGTTRIRPTTTPRRTTSSTTTPRYTTPKISTPKLTTPKSTTSSAEQPTTTTPFTTTSRTRTCTTPTPTPPQTKTQTIPFVYDPYKVSIPKSGPYAGQRIPHTNQAVLWNMCQGIARYNNGRISNRMTLTHGGRCFTNWNRRETCSENSVAFCRNGVNEYIRQFYPNPTTQAEKDAIAAALTAVGEFSCDEFPFASSVEGGDLSRGVRICVPRDDQNWQGNSMSRFFRTDVMKGDVIRPGDKYVIEIKGWDCVTNAPDASIIKRSSVGLFRRDAFSVEGVNLIGEEMWRGWDPLDPTARMMSMPLGDLDQGRYNVNLNTTNGAMNLTLLDYNGTPLDFTGGSDQSGTQQAGVISFGLDGTYIGVGLSGATYDDNLEVSFKAMAVSDGGSSTQSTAAPTSTIPSGAEGVRPLSWMLYLMLAVYVALIEW
ncbi:hypothetical protein ABW20_dc0100470 [Dactylellina cionopaga]|nr:hypothetical protein ABW20_dc0100470 [Dactylellina cionopaga]